MIDKLFLMLPEFKVYKHSRGQAYKAFTASLGHEPNTDEEKAAFEKAFAEAKKNGQYRYINESTQQPYEKLKRIGYHTTDASKLTRQQRNNLIIDIARGILQDPVIGEHFNSPGNFDGIKRGAREAEIMNSPKMINEIKSQIAGENGSAVNVSAEEVLKWIEKRSTKELTSFVAKYARLRSTASISSFTYFHRQNMVGAKLIGMYANNTSIQAKSQELGVGINPKFQVFINGRKLDGFTDVYHNNGKYDMRISKNCAEFSAASVDNAKDPVLASLLQDTNTANITGAMLRMGMSIDEIAAIYSNPILRANLKPDGAGIDGVKSYIKKWNAAAKNKVKFTNTTNVDTRDLKIATIAMSGQDIYNLKEMTDEKNIHARQLVVAATVFVKSFAEIGNASGNITSVSRADSPKGALQNTFAKALAKEARLAREIMLAMKDKNYPLTNAERLMPYNGSFEESESEGKQGNRLLQAFHSLGIYEPLHNVFPMYYAPLTSMWKIAIDNLIANNDYRIGEKTMGNFMNEMATFALSKTELFGDEKMLDGTTMTYAEKRDYYLRQFPAIFSDLKKKLPALRQLQVLNKIVLSEDGFPTLKFIGTTSARSKNRDAYISELESLFTLTDSKGNDLSAAGAQIARDLLRFTYYKYGLNFGPHSLGSLMSPAFLNHFPEYTAALRDMGRNFSKEDVDNFYRQFIAQNLYTSVPRRSSKEIAATEKIQLKKASNTSIDGRILPFINFNGFLYAWDEVDSPGETVTYVQQKSLKLFNSSYNANMTADELCETLKSYDLNSNENSGIEDLLIELGIAGEAEKVEELKSEAKEKDELVAEEQREEERREDSEKQAPKEVPSKYSSKEGLDEANEIKCEN